MLRATVQCARHGVDSDATRQPVALIRARQRCSAAFSANLVRGHRHEPPGQHDRVVSASGSRTVSERSGERFGDDESERATSSAALDAQTRVCQREDERDKQRSRLGVIVVTALAQRDAQVYVFELRAGQALTAR